MLIQFSTFSTLFYAFVLIVFLFISFAYTWIHFLCGGHLTVPAVHPECVPWLRLWIHSDPGAQIFTNILVHQYRIMHILYGNNRIIFKMPSNDQTWFRFTGTVLKGVSSEEKHTNTLHLPITTQLERTMIHTVYCKVLWHQWGRQRCREAFRYKTARGYRKFIFVNLILTASKFTF